VKNKEQKELVDYGEFEYLRDIIEPFPKSIPICILKQGQYFGELALKFTGIQEIQRTSTLLAMEQPTYLAYINKDSFTKYLCKPI